MNTKKENPWLDRFDGLDDQDEIRRRVTVAGEQLHAIKSIPANQIKREVERTLRSFYLPTQADLKVLYRLVGVAKGHCAARYTDRVSYISNLYKPHDQFESEFQAPICLTGSAGIGKSALLAAFSRLLPMDSILDLGEGHPTVPLAGSWRIQVKAKATTSSMLRPYIGGELGSIKSPTLELLTAVTTKTINTQGVSLIMVDEMQFFTQSASANTLLTKRLLELSYLGSPVIYAANYSLVRRLLKRNEEDIQRLLSEHINLPTPDPRSEDWFNYLLAIQSLMCDTLRIDLDKCSDVIYGFSAGLKRLVIQLVSIAYENVWNQGRRQVSIEDIENAYASNSFAANRLQVEALLDMRPSKRSMKYRSPLPSSPELEMNVADLRKRKKTEELWQAIQRDALPISKRKEFDKTVVLPLTNIAPTPPVKRARSTPVTAESLRKTHERRRQLGAGPDRKL